MEGKIKEEVKEQMRAKRNMFDGNKMVMTTIFIIVTAVIFLAIGYVAGKNSDDTTESVALETATVSPSVTKTAAASSSATGTTDETADWKTYTNDEYGFSFKYPKDWGNTLKIATHDESDLEGTNLLKSLSVSIKDLLYNEKNSDRTTMEVVAFQYDPINPEKQGYEGKEWTVDNEAEKAELSNKKPGDYQGQVNNGWQGYVEKQYKVLNVSGKNALVFYDIFAPGASCEKNAKIYLDNNVRLSFKMWRYAKGNDLRESLGFDKKTGVEEIDKTFDYFDQILSTFQFTK